jgi:SAM-dependent methyltransferase
MTPTTPDWDLGRYEHTAAQLQPAAEVLVDAAVPAPGERVVDIGCGTGNATLLAARRGAQVLGVDPAPRLLHVARQRAAAEGIEATFATGDAAALPVGDGEADLLLSVFGVIFAPDPAAAASELARVSSSSGRVVLSAWIPEGAIAEAARLSAEAVANALGSPPPRPRFPWQERDALEGLLGPHGFEVSSREHRIAFAARSAAEYLTAEAENDPRALATRAVLERRGGYVTLSERLLAIYEDANEDPTAFRITSRYVVATARRR